MFKKVVLSFWTQYQYWAYRQPLAFTVLLSSLHTNCKSSKKYNHLGNWDRLYNITVCCTEVGCKVVRLVQNLVPWWNIVLVVARHSTRNFVVQLNKYLFMEKSSKELDGWLSSVIDSWVDWLEGKQADTQTDVSCQSVSQSLDVSSIFIARNIEYIVLLFS